MARQLWIVQGDTTSHGGTVLAGDAIFIADGKPVARMGDPVACPKCKGVFPINSATEILIGSNGQRVARHGDKTACGAILIAGGQSHGVYDGAAGSGGGAAGSAAAAAANLAEELAFDQHFHVTDEVSGEALADWPYVIEMADGRRVEGRTDAAGKTQKVSADDALGAVLHVFEPEVTPINPNWDR